MSRRGIVLEPVNLSVNYRSIHLKLSLPIFHLAREFKFLGIGSLGASVGLCRLFCQSGLSSELGLVIEPDYNIYKIFLD